jgi:hypothetical protein
MPNPTPTPTLILTQVFNNVILSIETQEMAEGVGKMRMGDGGRRQPRHQPYARTPPKASHPRPNSSSG